MCTNPTHEYCRAPFFDDRSEDSIVRLSKSNLSWNNSDQNLCFSSGIETTFNFILHAVLEIRALSQAENILMSNQSFRSNFWNKASQVLVAMPLDSIGENELANLQSSPLIDWMTKKSVWSRYSCRAWYRELTAKRGTIRADRESQTPLLAPFKHLIHGYNYYPGFSRFSERHAPGK